MRVMTVKRLKVRLLTPPEDVSWGPKYIAAALGHKGFQVIEPHEGTIILDESEPPVHSVLWNSQGHLYLGSDDKIIVLDKNFKKKTEFKVPTQVETLYEIKDKGVLAAGEGWIARLVNGKGFEVRDIGYTAWKIAGKGNLVAIGTKEGKLMILSLETMKVVWSIDLQAPVTGLDWGPTLVAANANGNLYVINKKDEGFEPTHVASFRGISDLAWNPKGDELVLAINVEKKLVFLNQTMNEIGSVSLESIPIAVDYSPTSIEAVTILENGDLETVATPKVAKLVDDLIRASNCEKEGKLLCEALKKALWKLIGSLAPDVNVDEFYALKYLREKMIDSLACLNKHVSDIRKILKNVVTLEDVVEVLKDGCERFERWLQTIVKNADCIVRLSELLDYFFDVASTDILAAQLPTSVQLVETVGCENAVELVKCSIEVYRNLKKLYGIEEELAISLPVPGEVVLYIFLTGKCKEVLEEIKRLHELRYRAVLEAKEGNVDKVMKLVKEAGSIANKLKDDVEKTLPEGILES